MILTSDILSWQPDCNHSTQNELLSALENGKVIYFPKLPFFLQKAEDALLTPAILKAKAKNISYNPKTKIIKGNKSIPISQIQTQTQTQHQFQPGSYNYRTLHNMMSRYSNAAHQLLNKLIPAYQNHLILGRTSYRPAEIAGRARSIRQDDTRLHVDAFPTTPTGGNRILRVFTNINPNQEARVWHLGEPFAEVVKQFTQHFSKPFPGLRRVLSALKLTKTYRTLYDHYMLQLHNAMKESDTYQSTVCKQVQHFPAGSSWIVMTDQVSHAALSGQYVLEQTFYLPVNGMCQPHHSPLKVLERVFTANLL